MLAFWRILIPALILTTSLTAHTGVLKNLYEIEVSVINQADKERQQAIRRAFKQVLVRVTGIQNVASQATLRRELRKASNYVQQYQYHLRTIKPQAKLADASDAATVGNTVTAETKKSNVTNVDGAVKDQTIANEQERFLWIRFDEASINRMLSRNRFAIWGKVRPTTLIWLAIDNNGDRYLMGSEPSALGTTIVEIAKQRGLPVLLPLLDLEDEANLPFSDLWGDFEEIILSASMRYDADAVFVGRLSKFLDDSVQLRWSLYLGGDAIRWQNDGAFDEAVLAKGLHDLTDLLAKRFSVNKSDATGTVLWIHVQGVDAVDGFSRLQAYFSSLDIVTSAALVQANSEEMIFEARILGDTDAFKQAVELGDVLSFVADDNPVNKPLMVYKTPDYQLYYRLNR